MLVGITGFTGDGKTRVAEVLMELAVASGLRADLCSIAREAKAVLKLDGIDKSTDVGRQALATYIKEMYLDQGDDCFVKSELSRVGYVLGDSGHLVVFDDVRRIGEETAIRDHDGEIWRALDVSNSNGPGIADGEVTSLIDFRTILTDITELQLRGLLAVELSSLRLRYCGF